MVSSGRVGISKADEGIGRMMKDEEMRDGRMEGWKDSKSERDVKDEIIIELTIFKVVSIGSEFGLITCCFVKTCGGVSLSRERALVLSDMVRVTRLIADKTVSKCNSRRLLLLVHLPTV